MERILSFRKQHHVAPISILIISLITVALIAGMVGCDSGCNLTFSSTAGGSATAAVSEKDPVSTQLQKETLFGIATGTAVNITATPDSGYRFVEWQGEVGTIADFKAAATTITMNSSYTITACFVRGQEIRTWYHLDAIRSSLVGNHTLMNDLNSATDGYNETASDTANGAKGWQPIRSFAGTFDGQGYEIRDLVINRSDATGVGLFGYVDQGAVIQNVRVVKASVTGNSNVGGLVGTNEGGTVSSSNSSGSVTGNKYVGGLVGYNKGGTVKRDSATVDDSYSAATVTGEQYVGGLVGYNEGKEAHVIRSYSAGTVSGDSWVGGLVGWNQGKVRDSSSTGRVTGVWWVGGVAGNNSDYISNCSFTGSVTGSSSVGGLVGWNCDTITDDSYSSGNVSGSYKYVGGLVGYNKCGSVSKSYSASNVTGTGEHVGGLVGWNEGTMGHEGTVLDSYSTGNVKGTDKVGGLVGFNNHDGIVSKSYSMGNVTSEEGSDIGGLVGWNEGEVEDSHSSSGVSGRLSVGGLVGENDKTVARCYSCGSVTGDTFVGGLVGYNEGTVEESYSSCSVTGSLRSTRVGGLVGYNKGGEKSVSDSYSTGSVAGNQYVGGLLGYNEQSCVKFSYSISAVTGKYNVGGLVGEENDGDALNSFWDIETSGQTASAGGTGKTTAEMQDITTFEVSGWDIVPVGSPSQRSVNAHIWNIVVDDEKTYPFLRWQSV